MRLLMTATTAAMVIDLLELRLANWNINSTMQTQTYTHNNRLSESLVTGLKADANGEPLLTGLANPFVRDSEGTQSGQTDPQPGAQSRPNGPAPCLSL